MQMNSRAKILIVDDHPENLFALEKVLAPLDVDVFSATSGNDALGLALDHDFCVAILDVQMPEMDGYELAELLRGNTVTSKLPIIFLSAMYSDEYHHRKGYDSGAVDFLSKPYIPAILLSKIRIFMSLYHQRLQLEDWGHRLEFLVVERTTELSNSYDATLKGWAKALELRERETAGHSHRVVKLTLQMAKELGIPPEQQVNIYRGALLHDIGKMGVPDSILLKPGMLTPDEWEIMRKHPGYAYDLLRPIKFLEPALNIPYAHHEKWDGTGYPNGLKGSEIPFEARIFALVDVWDALTSDRPYRKAMTYEQIVQYILDQRGTHFDPDLAEKFLKMMDRDRDRE